MHKLSYFEHNYNQELVLNIYVDEVFDWLGGGAARLLHLPGTAVKVAARSGPTNASWSQTPERLRKLSGLLG